MANNSMFGWDLTFKSIESSIKQKSDVLIAFVHWLLMKRGFRVIDTGEDTTLTGNEKTSEVLPNDWNNKEKYTLRYLYDNKLYVLLGIHSDGNLIINLMKSDDLSVSNLAFNIDNTVQTTTGSIEEMIPTYSDVKYNIERDLINSTCEKSSGSLQTQTEPAASTAGIRLPPEPLNLGPGQPRYENLPGGPYNVGGADLNPFAPGGGMLFEPFGPQRPGLNNPGFGAIGGLPRGAVPPGARFDPFGPPDMPPFVPYRRPPPDADHFPPPGNDNMFM